MINMIKLGYTPNTCCWVHRRGQAQGLLAVYVFRCTFFYGRINDFAAQSEAVV